MQIVSEIFVKCFIKSSLSCSIVPLFSSEMSSKFSMTIGTTYFLKWLVCVLLPKIFQRSFKWAHF